MGLVAFDWGLMQSAESPGCYWILPKDHGETDRSLRPNYFWRLKLVETVLMTVDCIGSHQVYPWKIHETSIVGVCKVRNPAGTLVPFFRPRSIGSRNLFDLKHTHTHLSERRKLQESGCQKWKTMLCGGFSFKSTCFHGEWLDHWMTRLFWRQAGSWLMTAFAIPAAIFGVWEIWGFLTLKWPQGHGKIVCYMNIGTEMVL